MAVILKNMKMPERCGECRFCGFAASGGPKADLRACMLTGQKQKGLPRARMSKCPLAGVPDQHGRLIDADALLEEFGKFEKSKEEHGREFSFCFMRGGDVCTTWWNAELCVEDAPTVIQASHES